MTCICPVFFFSRDNQKCPWHTSSEILSRALLAFHGHIIENCHGQAQKFHGHFFQKSHGQVGNFTVNSKKSCHGQFKVCHGHFCSLTSKFLIYSYHNKGDIWTLASCEYSQWCQVLIPNMSTDEQARWALFFADEHERWALFIRWAIKMSTFFWDQQARWALFKRWATKLSTFLSDEQPRWALFSKRATKMSTFSSDEQPRWALYTKWAS